MEGEISSDDISYFESQNDDLFVVLSPEDALALGLDSVNTTNEDE